MTEIKTIWREITPELAKELLSRNSINRKLNDNLVNYYAIQMKKGQWKITGQGITIDRDGGLQDGQHRLAAIVKSGIPINFLMIYGLPVDSFVAYDRGKKRSISDVFHLKNIPNNVNVSASIRNYLTRKTTGQAMLFSSTESGGGFGSGVFITDEDILNEYEKNPELWQDLFRDVKSCYCNYRIFTMAVLSGISAYLILEKEYSKDKVISFMRQLHALDPDEVITTKLLRDTLIRDKMSVRRIDVITRGAFLHKTWNAFIKGKNLKILKYDKLNEAFPELK
jgi:hypothetical protein